MNFDFSTAAPASDSFGLIPDRTLAFGILHIRPYGPPDAQDRFETPSNSSDGQYLDCEVTICEGPYNKRKVFTKIGTRGSEAWINMGRSAIRSILEVGKGASPSNVAGYRITNYGDLDGLKVAIEIKIEKGKQGYNDKNDVAVWLTPNPESTACKKFQKLVDMAKGGYANAVQVQLEQHRNSQQPQQTQSQPQGYGAQQASPPAPQPAATNKPAWL